MNRKTVKVAKAALIASAVALLAACASGGKDVDFAQQIQNPGGDAVVLGKAWENGQKREARGLKLVTEGDTLLAGGDQKIREGESLVSTGAAQIAAQKTVYMQAATAIGVATTPKQLKAEIKILRDIAEKWDNGLDMAARGEKLIKDGEKDLADGRSKKRKGENMSAEGREQMRGVEARTLITGGAQTADIPPIE